MGRSAVNLNSVPTFIADPQSIDRVPGGRQIDWANVDSTYRSTPGLAPVVAAVSTNTSADAVALPVAALSGPIPNGTVLDFGAKKFVRLTAAAATGATSLTIAALVTALTTADTATYAGTTGSGNKMLPAGTPMGTLLGAGKASPRVASTNPATCLLETNAVENDPTAALSGYGMINGGNIFENMLPGAWLSGTPKVLATAVRNELNAAGVGDFKWFQYNDAR